MPSEAVQSTRKRILAATFVVLSRSGHRKLQLSEVAAEAGVSRPTLYRYFGSKQGLLDAFGLHIDTDGGVGAAPLGQHQRRHEGEIGQYQLVHRPETVAAL